MDELPFDLLLAGAGAMLVATVAWLADHRRMRRNDPDAVGFMPWTPVFLWGVFLGILLLAAGGRLWFAG